MRAEAYAIGARRGSPIPRTVADAVYADGRSIKRCRSYGSTIATVMSTVHAIARLHVTVNHVGGG